jgi:YbbR domain-containing protein
VLIEGADAAEACRGAAATFEPATVMVSGASSRVDAVAHASVADPGTGGASGSRVELDSVPVLAVNEAGEPVSNVTVAPETVQAVVEVIELETCAQVAVLPVYNDPPAGYYVAGIEVEPDHIQLRGDPARLAAVREESVVLTGLIDISNSRSTVETRAQLDLPADVEPVDASEGVTVTILVSPFPGTRLIEVPVDTVGIPTGLAVDGVSPSRIQVLVSGPLPELDNLDVTALRGTVDVTGLAAGTHRLRPGLDLPAGLRVRSIAPAEVDVRLVSGQPEPD